MSKWGWHPHISIFWDSIPSSSLASSWSLTAEERGRSWKHPEAPPSLEVSGLSHVLETFWRDPTPACALLKLESALVSESGLVPIFGSSVNWVSDVWKVLVCLLGWGTWGSPLERWGTWRPTVEGWRSALEGGLTWSLTFGLLLLGLSAGHCSMRCAVD